MSPDSSVPNARPAWRRKELVHPPKKTGRLFARGVEGQCRVTSRLCLFSVSPPGSVSDCGGWRKIRFCCRREAIYLRALWKNKLTAGQAVKSARSRCGVHGQRGTHCLSGAHCLSADRLSFSSFHPFTFSGPFCPPGLLSSWMRSWSWSLSVMELLNTQGKLFLVSLGSLFWLYGPWSFTVFCSQVVINWKHLIDWLDEGRLWPTLYAGFMT